MSTTIKSQRVFWVPPSRFVDVGPIRPKRVWTLMQLGEDLSQDNVPSLPIVPKHNGNAFLEDHIHDWNHKASTGQIFYYSRVALHSVWILCEYTEELP